MMLLCCFMLFLCLSANAEDTDLFRESGESVTLKCSSAGCSSRSGEYIGMYLYQRFTDLKEVLYYHSKPGTPDNITPRKGYKNRIETNGPLMNHSITISNLTAEDAGVYSCVYKKDAWAEDTCNVYTLVVRGIRCAPSKEIVKEKGWVLVLVIVATCTISMVATMMFILLFVPRVKKCMSSRKTVRAQISNDNVYEVMTKNGLGPVAVPENPASSVYDLA